MFLDSFLLFGWFGIAAALFVAMILANETHSSKSIFQSNIGGMFVFSVLWPIAALVLLGAMAVDEALNIWTKLQDNAEKRY